MFIRTVVEHSVEPGGPNDLARSSLVGRVQVDENGEVIVCNTSVTHDNDIQVPFVKVYACGCSEFLLKVLIGCFTGVFILCVIISIFARVPAMFALAVIFLIAAIVTCNVYCCPCCQPPKDEA